NVLLKADPALDYVGRLAMLRKHRIALWDVLKHCRRSGSLDAAIRSDSVVVNDFAGLLQRCQRIRRIAFNGKKAEQLFRQHVLPKLELPAQLECIGLPSTSPAHATMSFEQKLEFWRQALQWPR
ncbi:MAG: DNA-deoxyinosine glycosylase, partial [Pseudomonadota bacterium]